MLEIQIFHVFKRISKIIFKFIYTSGNKNFLLLFTQGPISSLFVRDILETPKQEQNTT